jgi:hypothetical protein
LAFADLADLPTVVLSELTTANAWPPGQLVSVSDQGYALYISTGSTWAIASLAGNAVQTSGAQTITGVKTFTDMPVIGKMFRFIKATGTASGDKAALDTAIASFTTDGSIQAGGLLLLEAKRFYFDNTYTIPTAFVARGMGRNATGLEASGSFPTDTRLIQLGTPGALAFGCRLENLYVDCNDVAGSTGVYSETINEQSGVFDVLIRRFKKYGWHLSDAGGGGIQPDNFSGRGIEFTISSTPDAGAIALYCNNSTSITRIRELHDITVNALGAVQVNAVGIKLTGCAGAELSGIHVEKVVTGLETSSPCNVHGFEGHSTVTNVVRVLSAASGSTVTLTNIMRNGATNTVVDDVKSITITGDNINYSLAGNTQNYGDTLRLLGTSDVTASDTSGALVLGQVGATNMGLDTNEIQARNNGAAAALFINTVGGTVSIGDTTHPIEILDGFIQGIEVSDPAAPSANKGRLYFRDNGSGKTQFCVRFPTGAIQVLSTEP